MRTSIRLLIVTLWVLAATATTAVTAPAAIAHSNQVSSSPAADAVVDIAPAEVSIDFGGELLDVGTAIVVRSAAGQTVSIGDPVLRRTSLTIATDPDAPPGVYTVAYRVLSRDGHPVTSSFTYTVAGASPSPTSSQTSTADPSPAAAASEAPVAADPQDSGGSPVLGIAIAVLLVSGLAVIGAVALKR